MQGKHLLKMRCVTKTLNLLLNLTFYFLYTILPTEYRIKFYKIILFSNSLPDNECM